MPRSATGAGEPRLRRRRPEFRAGGGQDGLSLVELLVVMAILGAMLGAVILTLPDTSARRLDQAGQRTQALLELACERAALGGRDMGIRVSRQALGFGHFDRGQFRPVPDSPGEVLRPRRFDADLSLRLRVDGQPVALPDALPESPQLACLASGELTPFQLELALDALPPLQLAGLPSGRIQRSDADAPLQR